MRPEGPGGIPEGAALTRDGSGLWKPPPPMGRGQNDGSVVGQISGGGRRPCSFFDEECQTFTGMLLPSVGHYNHNDSFGGLF